MPSLPAIYQDSFRILYAFLLPTVKGEALEVTIAALSVVEMMYILDVAMLLQFLGIDLLAGNYRLNLTILVIVFAMTNFAYFYPRRSQLTEIQDIPRRYRAILSTLLVLPGPLLLVVFVLSAVMAP